MVRTLSAQGVNTSAKRENKNSELENEPIICALGSTHVVITEGGRCRVGCWDPAQW